MAQINLKNSKFKLLYLKFTFIIFIKVYEIDCGILQNSMKNMPNLKEKVSPVANKFQCNLNGRIRNCSEIKEQSYALDLTDDGYLKIGIMDSKENERQMYFPPHQFCILEGGKRAKLCPSQSTPISWRKCCGENQLLNPNISKSCISSPIPFLQYRPKINETPQAFFVTHNKFSFICPEGFRLKKITTNKCAERSMTSFARAALSIFGATLSSISDDDDDIDVDQNNTAPDRFRISPNGTISYEETTGVFLRKSNWISVNVKPSSDLYCLDGVISLLSQCNSLQQPVEINKSGITGELDTIKLSACHNNVPWKTTPVLYICLASNLEEKEGNMAEKTALLAVIWIMTCPLLLCAALGNFFIIQNNVHGWILSCYLLSMCLLNVLSVLVILDVGREVKPDVEDIGNVTDGTCTPIDFAIKFFYMSTLCWITSINFGLWKTFSYTLPQPVGLRRFIASAIFSTGFPITSILIGYYVAFWLSDPQCKPEYCLLFSHNTIPFYSIPICVLVLGNFVIFVKTSYTIAVLRREADDVLKRQAEDHLISFTLFAKLFLLSGSIWLLRLVLFALQVQGMYLTWWGVMIEMGFSVPEVVFPIIVFHHPEFIKWSWEKAPKVSNFIFKINPFFNVPPMKQAPPRSSDQVSK